MTWATFATEIAWKASVLLAVACAAEIAMRKTSASVRHFVWAAVFAALVVLPAATFVVPHWRLSQPDSQAPFVSRAATPGRPARPANRGTVRILSSGQTAPSEPSRIPAILPFLWLAGCLGVSARFLAGALRTYWMVRHASPAAYAEPLIGELTATLGIDRTVRAVETDVAPLPLAWGVLRPMVILPEDAAQWSEARLRTVLLHELIHVRRGDLLAQAVAQAACCLYWFHPLTWLGWRQLRQARERACDDAVVAVGVAPHEYAGHLLDLVRALASKRNRWIDAPAMAESSDFESRVRALLDRKRRRQPLSRRTVAVVAAAIVAVLLPLAAIHAQPAVGTLVGSITDPSGARVAHCRVIVRNLNGSNQEITVADESGGYRFSSIPAGQYAIEFAAPGFAMAKTQAVLIAGDTARVDARLELGAISETLVIHAQKPPAAPRAAVGTQIVKVGGMVEPARLVRQPRPVYPADLQQLGVEGTVIMSAIISKDGTVLNAAVRNTVDPRLASSALEAVRQWVYKPALLNGEPVETVTTITLEFQLGQ